MKYMPEKEEVRSMKQTGFEQESKQLAWEYSRLSFAPARVSHVAAGANERRLYSQASKQFTVIPFRE